MLKPLYCCPEYIVDSDGYIISKKFHRPMKPSKNRGGYLMTTIMCNGKKKTIAIHSAVARTFLGDRTSEGLQVNHIDGNKLNNSLENLEWVTAKENAEHSVKALKNNCGKKNPMAKAIIGFDKDTLEEKYSFECISDGARYFSKLHNLVFQHTKHSIWRVLVGMRKSYLGIVWKYK